MGVTIIGSKKTEQLERKLTNIFDIQRVEYSYEEDIIRPLMLVFLSEESNLFDIYTKVAFNAAFNGDKRDCLMVILVCDEGALMNLMDIIEVECSSLIPTLNIVSCTSEDELRKVFSPFLFYNWGSSLLSYIPDVEPPLLNYVIGEMYFHAQHRDGKRDGYFIATRGDYTLYGRNSKGEMAGIITVITKVEEGVRVDFTLIGENGASDQEIKGHYHELQDSVIISTEEDCDNSRVRVSFKSNQEPLVVYKAPSGSPYSKIAFDASSRIELQYANANERIDLNIKGNSLNFSSSGSFGIFNNGYFTMFNGASETSERKVIYSVDLLYGDGEWFFDNGDKYVGEFRGKLPNGKGETTFAKGGRYIGEYVNGKFQGKGDIVYNNGDTFVGDFVDDYASGFGTLTYTNGACYIGEIKAGVLSGKGEITFSNGNRYVGEFSDGDKNGKGEFFFAGGDTYVGEFKDGAISGYGRYVFGNNGDVYVGEMDDWKFSGEGTYTSNDGTVYKGKFTTNGIQEGEATYPDGVIYKGAFDSYNPTVGAMYFPDGREYLGEYDGKELSGCGKMIYPNGDVYLGAFLCSKPSGVGQLIKASSGVSIGGAFDNLSYSGACIIKYADGASYTGEIVDAKYNGQGLFTTADGKRIEGVFVDGDYNNGQLSYSQSSQLINKCKKSIFSKIFKK